MAAGRGRQAMSISAKTQGCHVLPVKNGTTGDMIPPASASAISILPILKTGEIPIAPSAKGILSSHTCMTAATTTAARRSSLSSARR